MNLLIRHVGFAPSHLCRHSPFPGRFHKDVFPQMPTVKIDLSNFGFCMSVDTDPIFDRMHDTALQALRPLGSGAPLGFDVRPRIIPGWIRNRHEPPSLPQIHRDQPKHIHQPLFRLTIIQEPGAEHEIEAAPLDELRFRAVLLDEADPRGGGGGEILPRSLQHGRRDVDPDGAGGAPGEEIVGVEAGAAGEIEDAGAFDEGGDGGVDVVALDESDGGFVKFVVGRFDGVVLG